MSGHRTRGKGATKGGLTVQELKAMTAARIAQTQTIGYHHYPGGHHAQYRQQPDIIRGYASTANGVVQQHSLGSYQAHHNDGNQRNNHSNHMSSNHMMYGNGPSLSQQMSDGAMMDPYSAAVDMRLQAQNGIHSGGGSTMHFIQHDLPSKEYFAPSGLNSAQPQQHRLDQWHVDAAAMAGNARGVRPVMGLATASFFHPLSKATGYIPYPKPLTDRGSSSGETTLGDSDMHSLSSLPPRSLSGTNSPDSEETYGDSGMDLNEHVGNVHFPGVEYGMGIGGSVYPQPQMRAKGNFIGYRGSVNVVHHGPVAMADPCSSQHRYPNGGFRSSQVPPRQVAQQPLMSRYEHHSSSAGPFASFEGIGQHAGINAIHNNSGIGGSYPYFTSQSDVSVFGQYADNSVRQQQFQGAVLPTGMHSHLNASDSELMNKLMSSCNPFTTGGSSAPAAAASLPFMSESESQSISSSLMAQGQPNNMAPIDRESRSDGTASLGSLASEGVNSLQLPISPKSIRHKQQLPISCPSPLRVRSLSDCNSLAFEMAESVLHSVVGCSNPGSGSNTPRLSHKLLAMDGRRRTNSTDSDSVSPRNSHGNSVDLRRKSSKDSMNSWLSESEIPSALTE